MVQNIFFLMLFLFVGVVHLWGSPTAKQRYIIKLKTGSQSFPPKKSILSTKSIPILAVEQVYKPSSSMLLSATPESEQLTRYYTFDFPIGLSASAMESFLTEQDNIELFYPIERITLEQTSSTSVLGSASQQWGLHTIQIEQAWKLSRGKNIIIGVIDTGIEHEHTDLKDALWVNSAEDINNNSTFEPWSNTTEIGGVFGDLDGLDNDGNGFADDIIGYDFIDQSIANFGDWQTRDAIPTDEQGHGTSVSGVLIGRGTASGGVIGVAPEAKVMTLRAFDGTGNAEDDDVASAILYAVDNGVHILNLSFGDTYLSPLMRDAIAYAESAGVVIVSSSGNAGGNRPRYPSHYDGNISVGASNVKDELAFFSTFGSRLALVAPGEDIYTTAIGNSYRRINGTSFAAPHVAGVAALLLAKNPELHPRDIRGILQASADYIDGETGWSVRFGAGRLNAARALNFAAPTRIELRSPTTDTLFVKDINDTILVVATALTPILLHATIELGVGETPAAWAVLGDTITSRFNNANVANIETQRMQPGIYTLRLKVRLQNGNTLEDRIRFVLDSTIPRFDSISVKKIWNYDKLSLLIEAQTSQPVTLTSTIINTLTNDTISSTETKRRVRKHHFSPENIPFGEEFIIKLSAQTVNTTIDTSFTVRLQDSIGSIFPRKGITMKEQLLPTAAFVINSTAPLYGSGSAGFPICVMEGSTFGKLTIARYQPTTQQFTLQDSTSEVWIPRAMGDANGDGITDIFAQRSGNSILLTRSTNGNPIGQTLFSSGASESFWAAALFDLNKDGKDELIARNDTAFFAAELTASGIRILAQASNPTSVPDGETRNRFGSPYLAVGDFDRDNAFEIAFGDQDGDIVIAEFQGNRFVTEAIFEQNGLNTSQFIASPDVNGDGIPEILYGWHSVLSNSNEGEMDAPVFTVRLLQSTAVNTYNIIWEQQFYGLRSPNPFKSSVAAANIDNKSGDEIIIGLFPRCYVFRFDTEKQAMLPMWYHPDAVMNNIIAHDFNNNGIKEFGFETSEGIRFFEWNAEAEQLAQPTITTIYGIDTSTFFVQWNDVQAEEYSVISLGKEIATLSITTGTLITISNVSTGTHTIAVQAHRAGITQTSASVTIQTASPASPIRAEQLSARVIRITFTERLSDKVPPLHHFRSVNNGFPSTIAIETPTSLIATFPYALTGKPNDTLQIRTFAGFANIPTLSGSLPLPITTDTTIRKVMILTKALPLQGNMVEISFSEPITASEISAEQFTFSPVGTITSVKEGNTPTSVLLQLSSDTPIGALGKEYIVTGQNINSTTGIPLTTGAGAAVGFTVSAEQGTPIIPYPNPARLSQDERIMLAGIPRGSIVRVKSLQGELLWEMQETNSTGGVEWNFLRKDGSRISSGVYLSEVEYPNGEVILGKFIILP